MLHNIKTLDVSLVDLCVRYVLDRGVKTKTRKRASSLLIDGCHCLLLLVLTPRSVYWCSLPSMGPKKGGTKGQKANQQWRGNSSAQQQPQQHLPIHAYILRIRVRVLKTTCLIAYVYLTSYVRCQGRRIPSVRTDCEGIETLKQPGSVGTNKRHDHNLFS